MLEVRLNIYVNVLIFHLIKILLRGDTSAANPGGIIGTCALTTRKLNEDFKYVDY